MEQEKQISIIVAIAENFVIGKDNTLLWHLSDDLKRFKRLTSGKTVIMGRNTFFSLPVRPLPNRTNIVISRNNQFTAEGCIMAHSIEQAVQFMKPDEENFVIGGGTIYKQFLPLAQKLYITQVHKSFDGDTFFPEIEDKDWQLVSSEFHPADEKHSLAFTFQDYVRR